jgi:hypothetical protein
MKGITSQFYINLVKFFFKDVILHRKNLNERLGLTLCYGITSESTTNIYIEKVKLFFLENFVE